VDISNCYVYKKVQRKVWHYYLLLYMHICVEVAQTVILQVVARIRAYVSHIICDQCLLDASICILESYYAEIYLT
jgi:hypothetical protein